MRPPEVFVRELSFDEGARLKSISKRAKYQSKRQRAMILLASSTGMPAPQIAAVVRTDESHVRKVIHAFNDRGFASLDPDYRGGSSNVRANRCERAFQTVPAVSGYHRLSHAGKPPLGSVVTGLLG